MNSRWKIATVGCLVVSAALLAQGATAGHSVVNNKTPLARVKYGKILSVAAGGSLKNNTLHAARLSVKAECPGGTTVSAVKVASTGGATPWRSVSRGKGGRGSRGSSPKQTANVTFRNVPLLTGSAMRALCPTGKRETVFREVALELSAKCRGRSGSREVKNQFPQIVRLDCEEASAPAKTRVLSYTHACPRGYRIKGTSQQSKNSPLGFGRAMTCVKGKK